MTFSESNKNFVIYVSTWKNNDYFRLGKLERLKNKKDHICDMEHSNNKQKAIIGFCWKYVGRENDDSVKNFTQLQTTGGDLK